MTSNPDSPGTPENEGRPAVNPEPAGKPREPELPRWATRSSRSADGLSDARFAAFIGRNWTRTYSRKLQRFREDPSFVPTWNWAAALFTPVWFLYRKLYLAFAIFFVLPGFAFQFLTGTDQQMTSATMAKPENQPLVIVYLSILFSSALAAGGTANWLLFRRARAASAIVAMQQLPEDASLALLHRIGGVNRTPTIVLILISLVIGLATTLATAPGK